MSESVRAGEPATSDQVRHRRRVEPSGACVPVEAPKRHGNLVRRAAAVVPDRSDGLRDPLYVKHGAPQG